MAGSRFSHLVLLVSAVAMLSACSSIELTGNRIDGSGDVETRTFDVGEFDRVDISSAFEAHMTVSPGEATSVEVTADDNFFRTHHRGRQRQHPGVTYEERREPRG